MFLGMQEFDFATILITFAQISSKFIQTLPKFRTNLPQNFSSEYGSTFPALRSCLQYSTTVLFNIQRYCRFLLRQIRCGLFSTISSIRCELTDLFFLHWMLAVPVPMRHRKNVLSQPQILLLCAGRISGFSAESLTLQDE